MQRTLKNLCNLRNLRIDYSSVGTEQMSLKPGTLLGPHEIISLIGAGGMGEVYKARDTRLDRSAAILAAQWASGEAQRN